MRMKITKITRVLSFNYLHNSKNSVRSMPNTKSKFNSRFPPARIKKIMQTDEEVGKVAVAVPVLISKALEHFIESLLIKASQQTLEKNAKTLTQAHIKQCISREKVFDFLRDLVKDVPDLENVKEDNNSPGIEKRRHRNNRSRKKAKTARTKEDGNSEEESSSTESGEEDPCSATVPSCSLETTQVPYGDTQERMAAPVEYPPPVMSLSGPSFTAPPVTMPFLVTQPTDSAIPMGQYKPRKKEELRQEEEDYDS